MKMQQFRNLLADSTRDYFFVHFDDSARGDFIEYIDEMNEHFIIRCYCSIENSSIAPMGGTEYFANQADAILALMRDFEDLFDVLENPEDDVPHWGNLYIKSMDIVQSACHKC